ncbi:MAG: FKBP-type peptidyl-prolyl cis-trans isomerase N-terminal domain-containing protein [Burkholderiales bacterium]
MALLGPTYGGASWVSPPTYGPVVQIGDTCVLEAKAEGFGQDGQRLPELTFEWKAQNPEMVTVSPLLGNQFVIRVKRPGESRLDVSAQGATRELIVNAEKTEKGLRVLVRQDSSAGQPAPAAPPKTADSQKRESALPDPRERQSYAIGVEMGQKLKRASMGLDAELVARGLRDTLSGQPGLLTDAELAAALASLNADRHARQVQTHKQLAEKNRKDGEAFLAENKAKQGVVTLESGLQYKVLKAAEGRTPAANDTLVCRYKGSLLDGTEFDNSFSSKEPVTVPLRRVIRGWREALPLMPVGSRWQLFVPPSLAYGARGAGAKSKIGPNATLVFEVELLSIKEPAQAAGKASAPTPEQLASDRTH